MKEQLKKSIALVLGLALAASLAACGEMEARGAEIPLPQSSSQSASSGASS